MSGSSSREHHRPGLFGLHQRGRTAVQGHRHPDQARRDTHARQAKAGRQPFALRHHRRRHLHRGHRLLRGLSGRDREEADCPAGGRNRAADSRSEARPGRPGRGRGGRQGPRNRPGSAGRSRRQPSPHRKHHPAVDRLPALDKVGRSPTDVPGRPATPHQRAARLDGRRACSALRPPSPTAPASSRPQSFRSRE